MELKYTAQCELTNENLLELTVSEVNSNGFIRKISREVLNLKEKAVFGALKQMGWKPPSKEKVDYEKILKEVMGSMQIASRGEYQAIPEHILKLGTIKLEKLIEGEGKLEILKLN